MLTETTRRAPAAGLWCLVLRLCSVFAGVVLIWIRVCSRPGCL